MTPDELREMLNADDPYVFGAVPSGVNGKDYAAPPVVPGSPASFMHPAVRKLPVKSQQGGTCVGNSLTLCQEYLEYAESRKIVEFDGEAVNGRIARVEGAGIMPRDGLDLVLKSGLESQTDGVKGVYFIKGFAWVDNHSVDAMKAAISTPGQMMTVAIWLQGNFGENGGKTYAHYDGGQPNFGYHEVTLVGYDEQGVLVQNSWDAWWGDGGFCRLAWDYLTSDRVGESWVLTDNADTAGGYVKTYAYDINAAERAVKHKPVTGNTRPAVYLVKGNGRIWITSPTEAKRFGVDLSKVELLDDTNPVWALPVIGPDAPLALR